MQQARFLSGCEFGDVMEIKSSGQPAILACDADGHKTFGAVN